MTRIGIEKLAWLIDRTPDVASLTLGELAALYEETPERIMDAIDVLKIRMGEPTQIPPVPWPSYPQRLATCPNCGADASHLQPYDIGSGPELSCPHCEWCWGADGQSLKPLDLAVLRRGYPERKSNS